MSDRPALFDSTADPDIWSNVARHGERLTWRELADHRLERLIRLEALQTLVRDLDRCIHGRHLQDVCFDCRRDQATDNAGNPYLAADERLGSNVAGEPITVADLWEAAG